jgi:S1-C subfamily serine protease
VSEPDDLFHSPGDGGAGDGPVDLDASDRNPADLGSLVTSWNEGHPPVEDSRDARTKLVEARSKLAERVGGHPEGVVAPPVPEPLTDDEVGGDLDPDVDPDADPDADDDLAGVSALGWRDKRKAWRATERRRRKEAKKAVRFPIVTRSIMLWWLIFALLGLVGGGVAAYFWSDFNAEVTALKAENASLQSIIDQAKADIETQRAQTIEQINQSLQPLEEYANESIQTAQAVGLDPNSVWFVNTLDAEGRPLVGSAFVVASNDQESLLITSFATVREAAIAPGPEVRVRTNAEEHVAEVWNWDEAQDLALLMVKRPGLPVIEWAPDEAAAAVLGKRIFVVGAIGGASISAVPGTIVDQSAAGLQHTAPVGTAYQGGPIVTSGGQLLAVASLAYQPLGFNGGEVHFAVPIGSACRSVLQCGGGVRQAAGEGAVAIDPNAAPNTQD